MTQKAERCTIKHSGFGVFGLGLERLHFSPENRRVSDGALLLRRLKETLLAASSLLIRLAEGHEVGVIAGTI